MNPEELAKALLSRPQTPERLEKFRRKLQGIGTIRKQSESFAQQTMEALEQHGGAEKREQASNVLSRGTR